MQLNLFPEAFAICKLRENVDLQTWLGSGPLHTTIRDTHGQSVVCPKTFAIDPIRADDVLEKTSWRCFQIDGVLSFNQIGILAELSSLLAAAEISIFVVSSFETDYLLVQLHDTEKATEVFSQAGHQIVLFRHSAD